MARSTPLPIPTHERDTLWSDNHSMSSEDGHPSGPDHHTHSASPSMPTWIIGHGHGHGHTHVQSPTSILHTGQLSPVSPGMDPYASSASSSMVNSAASSYTDSWSMMDGLANRDPEVNTPWTSDDTPAPKVEIVDDDDFDMRLLEQVPLVDGGAQERGAGGAVAAVVDEKGQKPKRPRGRPRKHPLTPVVTANKGAKGRSKTGCITCRKRKKKCDEAKPRCMNCEKNAVVCEGYHEKQMWRSGKERAEEARLCRESLPSITMPPIFHGVETAEDKIFWRHYCNHLGNVLTVEGEHRNAFKDIVLQLATRHEGLMHSVLNLSAGHIDLDAPYGIKLLRDHSSSGGGEVVTAESLRARADFHREEAMRCLYEDMSRSSGDKSGPENEMVLTARYGQMLCLLLRTLVDGNPRGEHRLHLQAYQSLIGHSPPEDPTFLAFITEFFEYHIFADDLLSHAGLPEGGRVASGAGTGVDPSLHPPRLIGVSDGLFGYMSQITSIRATIRANILAGADQLVDYSSLHRAAEIDSQIRMWTPRWAAGDSRDRVALLYKQTMWLYLFRTIYPPSSSSAAPGARAGARNGMEVRMEDEDDESHGDVGTLEHESQRAFSPSRSSSEGSGGAVSRRDSMHQHDAGTRTPEDDRSSSPPPIRRPELQDPRITTTVEEALSLLETFKPSDPSQRLLLIPCLILGTACFTPEQQGKVRRAVRAVRGYTGMGNCDLVLVLLEEVWRSMGRGEWMRVWDWEGIARELGVDFLCA
ncbi:related to C6 zink-finger protein PRO1A [Cephalotrichum gorgonifer]|uniref:Related to C6 zink-finger protein PRO1A n=1 Tax=Cephalotrichum gorgonifer TaxID=2041049 RepID=A0AAE8N8S1_9PEZI|nr:related to C6 zink-finger protein PRO1A [Cephalotrichum gorgonifer]